MQIHSHKRKTGVLSPKRFINRLKRDNELFRGYMHQVLVTSAPTSRQLLWQAVLQGHKTRLLQTLTHLQVQLAWHHFRPCNTPSHAVPCQDAHEFLNYLLNQCSELLEKDQVDALRSSGKPPPQPLPPTWIQELFQACSGSCACTAIRNTMPALGRAAGSIASALFTAESGTKGPQQILRWHALCVVFGAGYARHGAGQAGE